MLPFPSRVWLIPIRIRYKTKPKEFLLNCSWHWHWRLPLCARTIDWTMEGFNYEQQRVKVTDHAPKALPPLSLCRLKALKCQQRLISEHFSSCPSTPTEKEKKRERDRQRGREGERDV